MNRTLLLAVPLLLATSSASLGQGKVLKDKEAVTFNEVERGFYLGVHAGPWFLVNAPANSGPRPFSSGMMAQVELGFDLGERLSLGVFVMGTNNRAGADYLGNSNGRASGDFSSLVPGAVVRASLLGLPDSQQINRTWIYLRGGAGFVMFSPKSLLPDSDIMVFAGPGVEYYTRLRHFSIGLELSGAYLLTSGTVGFTISPNLRYAF
jgi:hypothetical protein